MRVGDVTCELHVLLEEFDCAPEWPGVDDGVAVALEDGPAAGDVGGVAADHHTGRPPARDDGQGAADWAYATMSW